MTTMTKLLLYLGAVFAATTVGLYLLLIYGPDPSHRWWIGATALSSGWIFAGVALGPPSWARTAVPSAIAGLFAFFYVVDHSLDSRAWTLIAAAAIIAVMHVWSVRRHSHA
jgi:hypothetical protein